MRIVSIEMLDKNMTLAKDIIHKEKLVLKKGCGNMHRYADRLRNMGIRYLYIEDKLSDDIIVKDVISEDTRKLCKKTLINMMNSLVRNKSADFDELNATIEHIIQEITAKDIQYNLADIRTFDEYTFSHCISTTVYALLIAKNLNYSKMMMEQLAIGMMLHDIGKILLDSNILYKKEKLSYIELQYIMQHVIMGYEYIKNNTEIPNASKKVILCHHERLDGSGYPNKLYENQLDEFSKIAAIVDVYDALTSDRCYRKKWKTNKALKFLLENSGTKFDSNLVGILMKNIAIFPNGTTVRLSDGRLALIKEQNPDAPLRPIVKVYADRWGHIIPFEEVDLMKVLSITIIDSELEIRDCSTWNCVDI